MARQKAHCPKAQQRLSPSDNLGHDQIVTWDDFCFVLDLQSHNVVSNQDADKAIKLLHAEFFAMAAVHS